jgi:metal-responsive CopG/Arc/MetJ family transcriptional regulator
VTEQRARANTHKREGHLNFQVSLPAELVDRLNAICEQRMVGRNIVVVRAVEFFLDKLEAQVWTGD